MAANNNINDYLLKEMKELNPNLNGINYDITTNTISYNGLSVNLNHFSLSEIYNQYGQLKSDIEVINPLDLFNAISINVAVKEKEYTKNNDSIDQIQNIEPYIKNIKLIKEKNDLGTEKQFINITTTDGKSHTLYDFLPNDVIEALKNIAQRNGNSFQGITENDLFAQIRIKLEDKFEIKSKDDQDKKEEIIPFNDGSIVVDGTKLIDVPEYINIVENSNGISAKELAKKEFFESFMSNLYSYKSYLGKDALDMWNSYEQYIIVNSTLENYPPKIAEAIDVYNKINENAKQVELKNAENKSLVLNYQNELARKQAVANNRAGVASALLIVEITSFVSIILATIIFVLFRT
ncbi:MAG: hypothetical protein ACI31M_03245 [Bacilli bacterium]